MKNKLKLGMISLLAITLSPISVFAQNVDLGVNITGIPTIEAVTTIASDIEVNVANKSITATYLDVKNNSNTGIDVYVEDIEALDEGIPSTFLDYNSDDAWDLVSTGNVEDTNTKIAFGIRNGNNELEESYISIKPNTSKYLGYIESFAGASASQFNYQGVEYTGYSVDVSDATYRLEAKTGFAWKQAKKLNYSITMLVGMHETQTEENSMFSELFGGVLDVNYYKSSVNDNIIVGITRPEDVLNPSDIVNDSVEVSYMFEENLSYMDMRGDKGVDEEVIDTKTENGFTTDYIILPEGCNNNGHFGLDIFVSYSTVSADPKGDHEQYENHHINVNTNQVVDNQE